MFCVDKWIKKFSTDATGELSRVQASCVSGSSSKPYNFTTAVSKNAAKHPDSAVLVFIHVITIVCSCFLKHFSSVGVIVLLFGEAQHNWCTGALPV